MTRIVYNSLEHTTEGTLNNTRELVSYINTKVRLEFKLNRWRKLTEIAEMNVVDKLEFVMEYNKKVSKTTSFLEAITNKK